MTDSAVQLVTVELAWLAVPLQVPLKAAWPLAPGSRSCAPVGRRRTRRRHSRRGLQAVPGLAAPEHIRDNRLLA
jgi:hypothetical protein